MAVRCCTENLTIMDPNLLILSRDDAGLVQTHYVEPKRFDNVRINNTIEVIQPLLEPALERLPNATLLDCPVLSQATLRNYINTTFRNIKSGVWANEPKLQRIVELLKLCSWNVIVRPADGNKLQIQPKYGEQGQIVDATTTNSALSFRDARSSIPFEKKLFEALLYIKESGYANGEVLFSDISLNDVQHYNENFDGQPLANCLLVDRGPKLVAIIS